MTLRGARILSSCNDASNKQEQKMNVNIKLEDNTPERSFPTPYPNDNIRQSRRDSTEKELKVLSSASESIAGQSPTLTDSQQKDFIPERERIKLNNILHTGKLTNCNVSTFSDYEFADSSFVEDVLDSLVIEKGCCYLI